MGAEGNRRKGGEGMIVEARLIDGLSDDAVRGLFNSAREADYRALAKEIRAIEKDAAPAQVARLRAEAARIAAIDFFGANGREDVEARLAALAGPDAAPGRRPRRSCPAPAMSGSRGAMSMSIASARPGSFATSSIRTPRSSSCRRKATSRVGVSCASICSRPSSPTRVTAARSRCCSREAASTSLRSRPSARSCTTSTLRTANSRGRKPAALRP